MEGLGRGGRKRRYRFQKGRTSSHLWKRRGEEECSRGRAFSGRRSRGGGGELSSKSTPSGEKRGD